MSNHLRSRTVFSAREDSIEQSGIALISTPSAPKYTYTNEKQRRSSSPLLQRSIFLLIITLSCAGIYSFVGYYDTQRHLSATTTTTPIYTFPETNTMPVVDGNPHFIFHIGPPKTGTTTLQYALSDYLPVLKRDNYQYLGQVMLNPDDMWNHTHGGVLNILKDRQCMRQVNHARIHHQDERAPYPDCWRRLRSLLGEYRRGGQSLILSEENFSIKYTELDGGLERAAIDWIALAELLRQQGWHPIVVIGYRRLFEIMPSAKQQWDRWNKRNHRLNAWPPEGRMLEPLFPDVLNDPRLYDGYTSDWKRQNEAIQWSYTVHVLQQISPYIEVRMMNFNQPVSLRTNLLCHVIPGAPHSCAQSKLDDATDGETVRNTEE